MKNASSELKKFLDRKAFNKKAETSGAAALSVGDEAGISPMFLTKEYKKLQKSLKKFIKVAEKRGI